MTNHKYGSVAVGLNYGAAELRHAYAGVSWYRGCESLTRFGLDCASCRGMLEVTSPSISHDARRVINTNVRSTMDEPNVDSSPL